MLCSTPGPFQLVDNKCTASGSPLDHLPSTSDHHVLYVACTLAQHTRLKASITEVQCTAVLLYTTQTCLTALGQTNIQAFGCQIEQSARCKAVTPSAQPNHSIIQVLTTQERCCVHPVRASAAIRLPCGLKGACLTPHGVRLAH